MFVWEVVGSLLTVLTYTQFWMNGWAQVYSIEFVYSYSCDIHCILLYTMSGFHALYLLIGHLPVNCFHHSAQCRQCIYWFLIFSSTSWAQFHFQTSPTRTCVVPEGTFLDYTHILSTCHHCGGGWWSGVMLPWNIECLTKMLRITVAIYVWISEYMKINKCKIARKNVRRAKSTTGQVADWWDYPPAWSVYLYHSQHLAIV